ncbi:MAG: thioesterase family protein [Neisseria sp.]|nr:thioesterase family protein [Neisseria sp.]
MTVQIGDINYGNHLANDAVLRLCHEARIRWLASHHFTELDAGGCGLIMVDAALRYTAQARHGDRLLISLAAAETNRSGFALFYRITRPADSQTIATVRTGMVCFDYGKQKVTRLPQALHSILMPV